MEKYISELSTLLAFYENESRRLDSYIKKESEATIAVTNIEHDVIVFLSKKGSKTEKINERIEDIYKIRSLVESHSVLSLRVEKLIRECDKMRSTIINLSESKKDLESRLNKTLKNISDFNA